MKLHRQDISYFIQNAPLAMVSAALPGAVNYGVVLILSFFYKMDDVGTYRMLMSWFALMGLLAFQESGKVFIRAHAEGDGKALASLFMMKLYACFIIFVGMSVLAAFSVVSSVFVWISFLAILIYPNELFISLLQSQKRFLMLAVAVGAKYVASFAVFFLFMNQSPNALYAVLAMFGAMALFNLSYFFVWLYPLLKNHIKDSSGIRQLIQNKNNRDAFVLSAANFLPSTLEHFDKLIIEFVFGLEILGVYTLAFSTGRFIYNALKPSFYIYYRQFVEFLPQAKTLFSVAFLFTGVGGVLGLMFHFVIVPLFPRFEAGESVTLLLFVSYGVAMADALYCQSYGLHKKARSSVLLKTNSLISGLCLLSFLLCFGVDRDVGLLIAAAHFPLSHAGSIFLLSLYSRRA